MEKLNSMNEQDYALAEIEEEDTQSGDGASESGASSEGAVEGSKTKANEQEPSSGGKTVDLKPKGPPIPLIVGITVGVVVLCAISIGIYVYNSGSKKKEEKPEIIEEVVEEVVEEES